MQLTSMRCSTMGESSSETTMGSHGCPIEGDPPSPLQLPTSRRFNKERLIDLGDSSYVAGFPQLGGIHSGRDLMGMVPSGLL